MKWKLAACRINKGLKQKDVAELMHTSNTTIVNHERSVAGIHSIYVCFSLSAACNTQTGSFC